MGTCEQRALIPFNMLKLDTYKPYKQCVFYGVDGCRCLLEACVHIKRG